MKPILNMFKSFENDYHYYRTAMSKGMKPAGRIPSSNIGWLAPSYREMNEYFNQIPLLGLDIREHVSVDAT